MTMEAGVDTQLKLLSEYFLFSQFCLCGTLAVIRTCVLSAS
jgi:hypothetical protein